MSKTCSKCDEEKPLDCFMKRKDSLDGYRNMCKPCMPKYKQLPPLDNGPKICSCCKIEKPFGDFYLTNENVCKICKLIKNVKNRDTLNGALRALLSSAKSRSKDKSIDEITEELNNIKITDDDNTNEITDYFTETSSFDLTLEFMNELYERQNGLCYYSKLKMSFRGEFKMSIERLNNNIGYIKINIVLCILELNGQSHMSLDKIKEMLEILDQNIKENYLKFDGNIKENYYETARCKLKGLCTSAKSRVIKKNKKGRNLGFDIDFDFLVEMYNKQKGLCAYSNIPLKFGNSRNINWVISLERIDITKGYLKDNVCFICLEFNSSDYSPNQKIKSLTNTCWSKKKFELFLAKVRENNAV